MRTEALRRPAWIVGACLCAAAAAVAVLLFGTDWARVEEPAWLAEAEVGLAATPEVAPRGAVDFSVIWRRMEPTSKAMPALPASPPQLQSQGAFEVVATFCEDEAEFCYAVLRDRARKQCLVGVGDTVDGMKILNVIRNGVLVSRGGRQTFLKTVTPEGAAAQVAALGIRRRLPLFTLPAEHPSAYENEGEFDWADPFMMTSEQLQAYVANLSTLLAQVQVTTHYDQEGKADGLQIVGLQPQSVAAQRGLQQGDIVKMVYDLPLTDLRQVPRLAYQILEEDPAFVEVLIERDGEEQELIYDLRGASVGAAAAGRLRPWSAALGRRSGW